MQIKWKKYMENSVAITKKPLASLKNSSRIKSFRILLRQVFKSLLQIGKRHLLMLVSYMISTSFTPKGCFSKKGEGSVIGLWQRWKVSLLVKYFSQNISFCVLNVWSYVFQASEYLCNSLEAVSCPDRLCIREPW